MRRCSTIDSDSSDSEDSSTELETRREMRNVLEKQRRLRNMNTEQRTEGTKKIKALGFGDLCRYFQRSLSEDNEDDTAVNVSWIFFCISL